MDIDLLQQAFCRVVKDQDLPRFRGIRCVQLFQHGDHHIVRALVDEGDQDLLAVYLERTVRFLFHGLLADLPDKVPGRYVRHLIAQLFHQILVDVQGLGRPHIRHRIGMLPDPALLQEFRYDLLRLRCVEADLAAAQAKPRVLHQVVQRCNGIAARQVGRDMIRIGDADVRRRIGRDIGDHVVVDPAVICIEPHIHRHVRVQRLETVNCLLVDSHLILVRVVLRPEDDLQRRFVVKMIRYGECASAPLPVAPGEQEQHQQREEGSRDPFRHPLVPPLDTPAMIFFRKMRKRTISGTLMTTTAAIIAGVFSRPKPFSRISWIPFETR